MRHVVGPHHLPFFKLPPSKPCSLPDGAGKFLIYRWRFQLPAAFDGPVRVQLGQIEQRRIPPERLFAVRLETGIDLISIGAREELDRGAFAVGIGVLLPVRRRDVSKVEPVRCGAVSDERWRRRETTYME